MFKRDGQLDPKNYDDQFKVGNIVCRVKRISRFEWRWQVYTPLCGYRYGKSMSKRLANVRVVGWTREAKKYPNIGLKDSYGVSTGQFSATDPDWFKEIK